VAGASTIENRVLNLADTLVFPFTVTVQVLASPLHAPPQPKNPQPEPFGVAVSVTCCPGVKLSLQTEPQLMSGGELVTVPAPVLLMDRLVAKQKADGSVDDIKSSIVGSGGESLEVEGTALATLAWLRGARWRTPCYETTELRERAEKRAAGAAYHSGVIFRSINISDRLAPAVGTREVF